MTTTPTSTEVAELARRVATDGFEVHEDAVEALVGAAENTTVATGALKALGDRTASPTIRLRALGVVARSWPEISASLGARQRFACAFEELLRQSNEHFERRRQSRRDDIASLASSRFALDHQRWAAASAAAELRA